MFIGRKAVGLALTRAAAGDLPVVMHCLSQKDEDAREKERRDREQKASAARERLEREAGEAEARRRRAAEADAVSNYLTLLNEVVKDPDARWAEWKSKLQRDPQVKTILTANSLRKGTVLLEHVRRNTYTGYMLCPGLAASYHDVTTLGLGALSALSVLLYQA